MFAVQTDVQVPVPSDLQDPFSYNPLPKSHLTYRMVDGVIRVFEPPVDTMHARDLSTAFASAADGPEAVTPGEVTGLGSPSPAGLGGSPSAGPSPLRCEGGPPRSTLGKHTLGSAGVPPFLLICTLSPHTRPQLSVATVKRNVFQACTCQLARVTGKTFQKGATCPHAEIG